MTTQFEIDVRLGSPDEDDYLELDDDVHLESPDEGLIDIFSGPAFGGAYTSDAQRDSEYATWIALRAWRRSAARQGHKAHALRYSVYERDGWICQICLGPVERRLRKGHPHSATVDHIIPQAEGGQSTKDNLQLAHAICNHIRGDIPMSRIRGRAELFAAVRDEALRWMRAQERFREATAKQEKMRERWERRCRQARSGTYASEYAPVCRQVTIHPFSHPVVRPVSAVA